MYHLNDIGFLKNNISLIYVRMSNKADGGYFFVSDWLLPLLKSIPLSAVSRSKLAA